MRGKAYTSYARGGAAGQARPAAQKPAPKPEAPAAEAKAPDFRLIGRPTARVDGREIVTGRAKFTHDIKLQGMLIGKILRSPRAAAEVVSIDLAPALALPGVLAALKLADGKVRYAGQQVAAVAAVDERTAEKALALIKVEYKTLPAVVDWEKARDPNAPQVRDGKPNVDKLNEYARGDVEKGFAEADVVVEKTYRTGFEVHNPTETHGSVAAWEGDHLTVYDSTQGVHGVRDGLARALKVPAANVTVIKNYMGGGFGSKLGHGRVHGRGGPAGPRDGPARQGAALAARQRPVRRLPALVLPDLQGRGEKGRDARRLLAPELRLGRHRPGRRGLRAGRRPLQVPELQGRGAHGLHQHRRPAGHARARPHAGAPSASKAPWTSWPRPSTWTRSSSGARTARRRTWATRASPIRPRAWTSATTSGPRPSAGSGATASPATGPGRDRCAGGSAVPRASGSGPGCRGRWPTSSSTPTDRSRSSAGPRTSAAARGPTWPSSSPRPSGSSPRTSRSSSAIPIIPGRPSRAAA